MATELYGATSDIAPPPKSFEGLAAPSVLLEKVLLVTTSALNGARTPIAPAVLFPLLANALLFRNVLSAMVKVLNVPALAIAPELGSLPVALLLEKVLWAMLRVHSTPTQRLKTAHPIWQVLPVKVESVTIPVLGIPWPGAGVGTPLGVGCASTIPAPPLLAL